MNAIVRGRAAGRHTLSAVSLGLGTVILLLVTRGVSSSDMARDPLVRSVVVPLFGAGTLLLAGLTLYSAVKRLRFGVSRLSLDEPPVPGGSLSGALSLPSALRTASALSVTLDCERRQARVWWFGSFNVSVDSLKLWHEVQRPDPAILSPAPQGNRLMLQVSFAIPSEARLAAAGVGRVLWSLRVSASGPRFQDDFAVRVGCPS